MSILPVAIILRIVLFGYFSYWTTYAIIELFKLVFVFSKNQLIWMPTDEVSPNETEPVCWHSGGPHKQTLTNAVAQTQIRFLSCPFQWSLVESC